MGRGRLGRLELAEGCLPALFPCRRDQAIVGSDAAKLAFTQCGLLPQPLELLLVRRLEPLRLLRLHGHRLRLPSQFARGQRLEKRGDDPGVHRVRRHILADGDAILLP